MVVLSLLLLSSFSFACVICSAFLFWRNSFHWWLLKALLLLSPFGDNQTWGETEYIIHHNSRMFPFKARMIRTNMFLKKLKKPKPKTPQQSQTLPTHLLSFFIASILIIYTKTITVLSFLRYNYESCALRMLQVLASLTSEENGKVDEFLHFRFCRLC